MDADTLPNHALYHLSYTRMLLERSYYIGSRRKKQEKDAGQRFCLCFFAEYDMV